MWLTFLNHPSIFSRSFIDFQQINADVLNFYTDASKTVGLGGFYDGSWMYEFWDPDFIAEHNPSISYLELYAITAAVIAWIPRFKNRRIILFWDNQGAVEMINSNTSNCKRCMVLIHILVLQGLIHNVKINARHVKGKLNNFSDLLSRGKINEFTELAQKQGVQLDKDRTAVPNCIWLIHKVWFD